MLPEAELFLVLGGFMIAFILAFGIGANDVANSFGTSVGSKVLSLKSACILATIFEISGSVLLGGEVSVTIRGGIVDPNHFNNTNNGVMKLMYGQVASLTSSCIWMLVATFFKLPVSGSHSIVGATAGIGLLLFGISGIQWIGILRIVLSWFASPILSGIVSTIIFFLLKKTVLSKENPLEPALYTLPFIYGVTVLINVFSVLYGGVSIFGIQKIELWIVLCVSFAAGIICAVIVLVLVRPCLRKKIIHRIQRRQSNCLHETEEKGFRRLTKRITTIFLRRSSTNQIPHRTSSTGKGFQEEHIICEPIQDLPLDALDKPIEDTNDGTRVSEDSANPRSSESSSQNAAIGDVSDLVVVATDDSTNDSTKRRSSCLIEDRPEERQVFSFAQILSAIFGSFVHGANDVSNAIGPVVGLWLVAVSGDPLNTAPPPIWILFYGGIGISIGLWVWGRKVMETVGTDLTTITPSSGVCIELGSAVTVLIASNLGVPISTTHCKVGSVVCVGRFRSKSNVNWKLFLNIVIAWIVTLPVSAGLSALIMYILTQTLPLS